MKYLETLNNIGVGIILLSILAVSYKVSPLAAGVMALGFALVKTTEYFAIKSILEQEERFAKEFSEKLEESLAMQSEDKKFFN